MHYRLHLNAYRYLLQRYYGHTVSGMFVVCTHPDKHPEAWVDPVPVMDAEIQYVVECQRRKAREVRWDGGASALP